MNTHPSLEARTAVAAQPLPDPVIHIVDDDPGVCTALARLLAASGYDVRQHPDAEEFLQTYEPAHGCLLVDVWMPGIDGLELQARLAQRGDCPPIIFLTCCADVSTCACAMRGGAVDYLTKPVDEELLLPAIDRALAHSASLLDARRLRSGIEGRLATLTPRERQVLTHVMNGRLNKQIAADLGSAEKTVKVHRARAMEKMGVRSVAELVRMVERARAAASRLS